eukprot:TRINITY_DN4824_c0_g1_i1.p1 TRINITY_DN4824_c0_g1~~TRINITY_DN4824_c0_g1_i1.p1  ORF type:complete len:706 (-),score=80.48 TRINITY_DN4824_c0_g1_i1:1003-2955(-)
MSASGFDMSSGDWMSAMASMMQMPGMESMFAAPAGTDQAEYQQQMAAFFQAMSSGYGNPGMMYGAGAMPMGAANYGGRSGRGMTGALVTFGAGGPAPPIQASQPLIPTTPLAYTGPPDPSRLVHREPGMVNTGPPLHARNSIAPEARTVYVNNIPAHMDEHQLRDFLSIVGNALKIKFNMSGNSVSKWGFVEFETVDQAHTAIGITGVVCCGHSLKISQSKGPIGSNAVIVAGSLSLQPGLPPAESEQTQRTVTVSRIDPRLNDETIVQFLSACGKILHHRILNDPEQQSRYGFFEFETLDSSMACKKLTGTPMGATSIVVNDARGTIYPTPVPANPLALTMAVPREGVPDQVSRTVYVGNLDFAFGDQDIQQFFEEKIGRVLRVAIAGDANVRYAFVEFEDPTNAARALQAGSLPMGSKNVKIGPARGPITKGVGGLPGQGPTPTVNTNAPNAHMANPLKEQQSTEYALALQLEQRKYLERMEKYAKEREEGKRKKSSGWDAGAEAGAEDKPRRRDRSRERSGSHRRDRKHRSRTPEKKKKRSHSKERSKERAHKSRRTEEPAEVEATVPLPPSMLGRDDAPRRDGRDRDRDRERDHGRDRGERTDRDRGDRERRDRGDRDRQEPTRNDRPRERDRDIFAGGDDEFARR